MPILGGNSSGTRPGRGVVGCPTEGRGKWWAPDAEGNDRAFGGGGDDEMRGNAGDDILRGRAGDDLLYGQAGNDTLDGGADTDSCRGGTGVDTAPACETTVGVP